MARVNLGSRRSLVDGYSYYVIHVILETSFHLHATWPWKPSPLVFLTTTTLSLFQLGHASTVFMQEIESKETNDDIQGEHSLNDTEDSTEPSRDEQQTAGNDDDVKDPGQISASTNGLRKRLRTILLICAAIWLAIALLRAGGRKRSKVVYAHRCVYFSILNEVRFF